MNNDNIKHKKAESEPSKEKNTAMEALESLLEALVFLPFHAVKPLIKKLIEARKLKGE